MLETASVLLFVTMNIEQAAASKTFLTRSGRLLPLAAVLQHQPSVTLEELPQVVFEYHKNGSLISHHAHININSLAPRTGSIHRGENPTNIFRSRRLTWSFSTHSTLRQGHGYTFVFDESSNVLIAAWGPALLLHPVDPFKYPALLLNVNAIFSRTESSYPGLRADRAALAYARPFVNKKQSISVTPNGEPNKCKQMFVFRIAVSYDAGFLKLYGGTSNFAQSALNGLIAHVAKLYERSVCVTLSVRYNENFNSTMPQRLLEKCEAYLDDPVCTAAANEMLTLTVYEFPGPNIREIESLTHEVRYLITGFVKRSPLSGATHKSAVCHSEDSVGWINGANPAVFAHEVGHMLGAPHDEIGVMTEITQASDEFSLSPKSISYINRFLFRDSRSWCLKRDPIINDNQVDKRWIPSTRPGRALTRFWSMTAKSPRQGEAASTIYVLAYRKNFTTSETNVSIFYFPEFPCQSKPEVSDCMKRSFGVRYTNTTDLWYHSLAVGHVQNSTSTDLVLSYTTYLNGYTEALYHIGFDFQPTEGRPETWSQVFKINTFTSDRLLCSDISLGYVRGGSTPDLIYVFVDNTARGTSIKYYVGFDLGPNGMVRKGWSDAINIPNLPKNAVFVIGLEVRDLDHNGMPELVVSQFDDSTRRLGSWLRVGRDLNASGHVTKGWTSFIKGFHPPGGSRYNIGAMTLYTSKQSGTNAVLLQQNDEILNIFYRRNVVTPAFLETAESRPAVSDFVQGCKECYEGEQIQRCIQDFKYCQTKIDLVMNRDVNNTKTSTSNVQRYINDPTSMRNPAGRQFVSRSSTIYCDGFRFLEFSQRSCETIDRQSVTAKGVEFAFMGYFAENWPSNTTITINTLLDDPLIQNSGEGMVAANIEITGNRSYYRPAVQSILQKLELHRGMEQFDIKEKQDGEDETGEKYRITFIFKSAV